MRSFRAPWSLSLLIVSAIGTAVLLVVAWCVPPPVGGGLYWLKLVPLAILVGALAFVVRGFEITPGAILVRRFFWTTRIPRAGLIGASVEPQAMKGSLRICGNSGLYAFNGFFWSKPLGRFRAYVTDQEKTVVLRFEKRVVVLSPDNPEEFVRSLNG
ncbi:MAG: PH domain-containing protein [Chthoniobacteraceae bacterium]